MLIMVASSSVDSQFLSPLPKQQDDQEGKEWLLKPSLKHGPSAVKGLYRSIENSSGLLNSFSGQFGSDRAVVISEVLSGVGGIVRVSLSTAVVISKNDTSIVARVDSTSETTRVVIDSSTVGDNGQTTVVTSIDTTSTNISSVETRIDTLDDLSANITRIIMNGGALSIKLLYPIFSGTGPSGSGAGAFYVHGGLGNSLAKVDDEKPIGVYGATLEFVGSLALRAPKTNKLNFELMGAVKAGTSLISSELDGLPGQKRFDHGQIAVGIRQAGRLSYSFLYTKVNGNAGKEIPAWSVSLATGF